MVLEEGVGKSALEQARVSKLKGAYLGKWVVSTQYVPCGNTGRNAVDGAGPILKAVGNEPTVLRGVRREIWGMSVISWSTAKRHVRCKGLQKHV
jgi:hypothetical protein